MASFKSSASMAARGYGSPVLYHLSTYNRLRPRALPCLRWRYRFGMVTARKTCATVKVGIGDHVVTKSAIFETLSQRADLKSEAVGQGVGEGYQLRVWPFAGSFALD